MIWLEFGRFTCPNCDRKVSLRDTKNDLAARMEAPKPFKCPHCNARIVFQPWRWTFRLSFLAFLLSPMGLLYLGVDSSLIVVVLALISIPLCASLLSKKLVLHQDG